MFEPLSATPLATTNLLLGIMAAVSVLEALLLVAVAVVTWKVYNQSLAGIAEARAQIEPLAARVSEIAAKMDAIADDVKDVTSVARRTAHLYGLARGVRAAYDNFVRRDENRGTAKEG